MWTNADIGRVTSYVMDQKDNSLDFCELNAQSGVCPPNGCKISGLFKEREGDKS